MKTETQRERIRAAYDPELFTELGQRLAASLGEHLKEVESSRQSVLNWSDPAEYVKRAEQELPSESISSLPEPETLGKRFSELVKLMLAHGNNLHDPRYLGHQVPASIPLAGLFDAVGSVTNQVMAIYEMGPWASAVEALMVQKLGELIGWPAQSFAGLITHGGSLANLTALLTARNVVLGEAWERGVDTRTAKPPVLVAHAEAHYCIARSAGILGLGTNQVLKADLDDRRRMDPERLDVMLTQLRAEGQPIVAVVACACATPVGAFDPLDEIADVCQKHEVWMHVDAAHGGAALFSENHRHLLKGLERADSLIWDAHKMLFVPALCAFVFYKNAEHRFEAFRQEAPYLFDPSAPGLADFDSGLRTVECTKRAAAYGLWGVWSLFGRQLFGDLVDVTFDLGRQFYEKLKESPEFEPLHEPECNIVVFRHIPEMLKQADSAEVGQFQLRLRRAVIQAGEFYIVPTTADGQGALRVTLINPLTTTEHLDLLLETLRTHGQRLLSDAPLR